jgi:hypothetical protein
VEFGWEDDTKKRKKSFIEETMSRVEMRIELIEEKVEKINEEDKPEMLNVHHWSFEAFKRSPK